jgi:dolichol-phosphate mannosyltransferase
MQSNRPVITIVVPVYNEENTVTQLAAEIQDAFTGFASGWEALWIDDGSTDGTAQALAALSAPQRCLRLASNQGQSAALMCGFQQARGEWIGTLDGDGQNDPHDLPRQLAHAQEQGVDMVNGIRARCSDGFVRRLSSRIGNGTRNWLTADTVSDVGCSTRVVRRACLLHLPFFHGMHRFLPTLVRMQGGRILEISVHHRPRAGGRSKYGISNRLWSGLRDIFGVRWLLSRQRDWQTVVSCERA